MFESGLFSRERERFVQNVGVNGKNGNFSGDVRSSQVK